MDRRTLTITTAVAPDHAPGSTHDEGTDRELVCHVRGLEMASDDARAVATAAPGDAETLIEGIRAPRLIGERRFDYLSGAISATQLEDEAAVPKGFSFFAWLRPETGTVWTKLEDIADAPAQDDLMLIVDDGDRPVLHACIDGHYATASALQPLPRDRWSHLAATFDPKTGLRVYVDGEVVMVTGLAQTCAAWTPFARQSWDLRAHVAGQIGDLRIEDSCLTPNEVRRHMLDGAPAHADVRPISRSANAGTRDACRLPDVARAS